MTKDEAFEQYLEANAKEKEAWGAYLKACAVTQEASKEHDRLVFAELEFLPRAEPEAPTHPSMVTDSLEKKGETNAHSETGS